MGLWLQKRRRTFEKLALVLGSAVELFANTGIDVLRLATYLAVVALLSYELVAVARFMNH